MGKKGYLHRAGSRNLYKEFQGLLPIVFFLLPSVMLLAHSCL